MKQLHIDFAPLSWYRRLYAIRPQTWLTLIVAGVWLLFLLSQQLTLQQTIQAQNAQLERDQARLAARAQVKAPVVKSTISPQQAKAVNQAIHQLNLPWRDLLAAMEQATGKDIALLALEPDPKNHVLRAQAESKTSHEMADYLKRLRHVGLFDNVMLTRHEVNEQDPNHPLRFQFEAHWQTGGGDSAGAKAAIATEKSAASLDAKGQP